jgi:hypothetical protein
VAGLAAKLAHVRHPLDLNDVIRSAEEDRENAKQRKRETEDEESSGAAWPHATRSLPANGEIKGTGAYIEEYGIFRWDFGHALNRESRAGGGMMFHVLNRGAGRMQIFRAEKDYDLQLAIAATVRLDKVRQRPLDGSGA